MLELLARTMLADRTTNPPSQADGPTTVPITLLTCLLSIWQA